MVHPVNCEQQIREMIVELIEEHVASKDPHAQHEKGGDDQVQTETKPKKGKKDG